MSAVLFDLFIKKKKEKEKSQVYVKQKPRFAWLNTKPPAQLLRCVLSSFSGTYHSFRIIMENMQLPDLFLHQN